MGAYNARLHNVSSVRRPMTQRDPFPAIFLAILLPLPAELNGFPGPRHLLELADSLALTPEQRSAVEGIFGRMAAEAKTLGARVVEAEKALDDLFASGRVRTVRDADGAASDADGGRCTRRIGTAGSPWSYPGTGAPSSASPP